MKFPPHWQNIDEVARRSFRNNELLSPITELAKQGYGRLLRGPQTSDSAREDFEELATVYSSDPEFVRAHEWIVAPVYRQAEDSLIVEKPGVSGALELRVQQWNPHCWRRELSAEEWQKQQNLSVRLQREQTKRKNTDVIAALFWWPQGFTKKPGFDHPEAKMLAQACSSAELPTLIARLKREAILRNLRSYTADMSKRPLNNPWTGVYPEEFSSVPELREHQRYLLAAALVLQRLVEEMDALGAWQSVRQGDPSERLRTLVDTLGEAVYQRADLRSLYGLNLDQYLTRSKDSSAQNHLAKGIEQAVSLGLLGYRGNHRTSRYNEKSLLKHIRTEAVEGMRLLHPRDPKERASLAVDAQISRALSSTERAPLQNPTEHRHSGNVQTFIVSKEYASSLAQARAMARRHHAERLDVDETGTSYRFRQRDPSEFVSATFRTYHLEPGVAIVVGKRIGQNPSRRAVSPTRTLHALQSQASHIANIVRAAR